jgi:hypothetical protein
LAKKNCALLKIENEFAPEREEISQKFQRIWIQQAKTIFSMKKKSCKITITVKNTRKLSLLIFRFRVKILSNKKSGIPTKWKLF